MKLNIFHVQKNQVKFLKQKLELSKMREIYNEKTEEWEKTFYFSQDVDPVPIPWIQTYQEIFKEKGPFENKIFYGAYLWENANSCLVISYGKSHFYLRKFCDRGFGLEIAKRLADEEDVRQKCAKKFAGKKKKEIKSYERNTTLDIESGESVDYIQAGITVDKDYWGKTGKFGDSAMLYPEIKKEDLPIFLNKLLTVLKSKPLFDLPRTEIIHNENDIKRYDQALIDSLSSNKNTSDFSENSPDLVGVDFVFSHDQTYQISYDGINPENLDALDTNYLTDYIAKYKIKGVDIFKIRLTIKKPESNSYSQEIKDVLEYKIDDENVVLSNGKWTRFNEDYMKQLHEYIDDKISLDENFDHNYETITITKGKGETDFNELLKNNGYEKADQDFSKIKIKSHKIEAWDQRKGNTVFAIKFGKPQKIGYVCDQASSTIDIMRHKPGYIKKLNFKKYCLWLGLDRKKPTKLSDIRSIIFKQKLESRARKCHEIGIEPIVWLSVLEINK